MPDPLSKPRVAITPAGGHEASLSAVPPATSSHYALSQTNPSQQTRGAFLADSCASVSNSRILPGAGLLCVRTMWRISEFIGQGTLSYILWKPSVGPARALLFMETSMQRACRQRAHWRTETMALPAFAKSQKLLHTSADHSESAWWSGAGNVRPCHLHCSI